MGARWPYSRLMPLAVAVRSRSPRLGRPGSSWIRLTTSVPPARPVQAGCRSQRPCTSTRLPASAGWPTGHRAVTSPLQPPPTGPTCTRPPESSTGSRSRSSSSSRPSGRRAAQLAASAIRATVPWRAPSRAVAPQSSATRVPARRAEAAPTMATVPRISATSIGTEKRARPVARPAPNAATKRIGGRAVTAAGAFPGRRIGAPARPSGSLPSWRHRSGRGSAPFRDSPR